MKVVRVVCRRKSVRTFIRAELSLGRLHFPQFNDSLLINRAIVSNHEAGSFRRRQSLWGAKGAVCQMQGRWPSQVCLGAGSVECQKREGTQVETIACLRRKASRSQINPQWCRTILNSNPRSRKRWAWEALVRLLAKQDSSRWPGRLPHLPTGTQLPWI